MSNWVDLDEACERSGYNYQLRHVLSRGRVQITGTNWPGELRDRIESLLIGASLHLFSDSRICAHSERERVPIWFYDVRVHWPQLAAELDALGLSSEPVHLKSKGRTPHPVWEAIKPIAMQYLDENGYPVPGDGGQAKLEDLIKTILANHQYYPAESTVRSRAVEWIKEYIDSLSP